MWSAGEANIFEGYVNVDVELNGHKYLMQNAVVIQTEFGLSITTDNAILIRLNENIPR